MTTFKRKKMPSVQLKFEINIPAKKYFNNFGLY